MGGEKVKKRWRIGGIRNKSKPKVESSLDYHMPHKTTNDSSPDYESQHTDATNAESSFGTSSDGDSNGSGELDGNNNNVIGSNSNHQPSMSDLPPTMSDPHDSDSDDDDLYLENNNNFMKGVDKYSTFPKAAAAPRNDNQEESRNPFECDDQEESFSPPTTPKESQFNSFDSDDNGDGFLSDHSSIEEDMKRHEMERRNSRLAKISEDSDELLFNSPVATTKTVDNYDLSPISPEKRLVRVVPAISSIPAPPSANEENVTNKAMDVPSAKELSKELCKLVATEHYSGQESLIALKNLSQWAHTQNSTLLKHLLTYGGVVKVIDFLDEQIQNASCKASYSEEFLMEAIHKAADVICNVCFVGKQGINEDIAVVNATVVVKYGGIQSLLMASQTYNKCEIKTDPQALKASEGVWNAIMNVYCNAEAAVTKELSMLVLDAAIESMQAVGSVDHPVAAETLANIFNSLYRITYHDFVTKEEFQSKGMLKHCLDVFKRDVTSSEGDEELLEEALSFLFGCHEQEFFNKGSDYESVLPLCVMGLREYADENENIREWASRLLDGACSNIEKKECITMAEGAIEVLAPFLTFKDVDAEEKTFLRNLIRKIVAV